MYEIVIVPLDGSPEAERALGPARAVAAACGAELELVRVATDNDSAEAHEYLDGIAGRISDVRVRPPVVPVGSRAGEGVANAAEAPASLVVMTTHGRSGLRRALLGSVAEEVLREVRSPLLLVGPKAAVEQPTAGRMIVCSDGSPSSEAILPVAEAWARSLGLTPTLLTVVDADAVHDGDVVEWGHVEHLAREWTDKGLPAEWEVISQGRPQDVIVDRARNDGTAVIALATHGRTSLARIAIGSVAADVVRHAPCPVLVCRPATLS